MRYNWLGIVGLTTMTEHVLVSIGLNDLRKRRYLLVGSYKPHHFHLPYFEAANLTSLEAQK